MSWVGNDGVVSATDETVEAGRVAWLKSPAGAKLIWLTKE